MLIIKLKHSIIYYIIWQKLYCFVFIRNLRAVVKLMKVDPIAAGSDGTFLSNA